MAIKFGRPIESRTRVVPVEPAAPGGTPLDLTAPPAPHAPRRLGRAAWCARTCLRPTI